MGNQTRRIELDSEHDEVQVFASGKFIGAGACYKWEDTQDVMFRIINVWILGI